MVAAAGAGAGVLAAEVWAAARRRYASAGSAPPVEGDFGDPGGERLRLVMLGDSTGAGVGVTRTEDTVGGVLARRLAGPTRRVRLAGAAIAGSGTGDLGPQVSRALLGRPDVAVLLVGTTDATSGTALGAVRDNLGDAVRRLLTGGAAVVVGTCPDLGASRVFAQPLRSVVAWRGRHLGGGHPGRRRGAGRPGRAGRAGVPGRPRGLLRGRVPPQRGRLPADRRGAAAGGGRRRIRTRYSPVTRRPV
jgi:hypothetical protein